MRRGKLFIGIAAFAALGWMIWIATSTYIDNSGAARPADAGNHVVRAVVLALLFGGLVAFIVGQQVRGDRRRSRDIVHDKLPPSKRQN